jgi:hypothetical protein
MRRLTIEHNMIFASLASIFVVTLILTQQSYQATAFPQQQQGRNQTFGIISSVQNDASGQPAWVVAGQWTSALLGNNSVNASQPTGNSTVPFGGSPFDTQIQMVRLNGTAGHTHTITNFVLANASQPDNMTKIFNGTSTASMIQGPVADIRTSIRIMGDKVISIWLDPTKIESHYGNTSIYGLVMDADKPRPGPVGSDGPQMRK